MKQSFFWAVAAIGCLSASTLSAATVQALSDLTITSRWAALTDAPYDDIALGRTVENQTVGANAMVGDPAAVVAISDSFVQIGNQFAEPRIPFISSARERVNRLDPTEFADAQRYTEIDRPEPLVPPLTDSFFLPFQTITQTGLAQLRIGAPPVQASASSLFDSSVTTSFENLSNAVISMLVVVQLDMALTGRFSGDDGVARAEVARGFEFAGTVDGAVVIDQGGPDTLIETGTGADASFSLGALPGKEGALFKASAIAQVDGGFTEARANIEQDFSILFEIPAFGTVSMTEHFSQVNTVGYRNPVTTPPAVPLPAGALLLASGLFSFGFVRRVTRPSSRRA